MSTNNSIETSDIDYLNDLKEEYNFTILSEQEKISLYHSLLENACCLRYEEEDQLYSLGNSSYCNSTFDRHLHPLCWPTTQSNTTAFVRCPKEGFGSVKFHEDQNVTRFCQASGTWANAYYKNCIDFEHLDKQLTTHASEHVMIYKVGYIASTVALIIAIFTFLYFRKLRCLRNYIHINFMASFILRNIVYLMMTWLVTNYEEDVLKMVITLRHYTTLTTYFWMLVEGIYLHMMVVWTFNNQLKLWHFLIIGWGAPVLIVVTWIGVKLANTDEKGSWIQRTDLVYIIYAPVFVILAVNSIILYRIIRVLVTKLNAPQTSQASQTKSQIKQYWKAVKALLFLLPLLGMTYIIFIVPWSNDPTFTKVHNYCNAILQSTQGLAVAIIFCFLNGEVRSTVANRFSRWREVRRHYSTSTRTSRLSMTVTRHSVLMHESPLIVQLSAKDTNGNADNMPTLNDNHKLTPCVSKNSQDLNAPLLITKAV